jgi:hypothetical protein
MAHDTDHAIIVTNTPSNENSPHRIVGRYSTAATSGGIRSDARCARLYDADGGVCMIDWETHKDLFEWDGSWRDLSILDTRLYDWQRLIDHLRERAYQLAFTLDDMPHPVSQTIENIFAAREHTAPLLSIYLDYIQVNCHFFDTEQIEFDIDPREITVAAAFTLLLTFMANVGSVLAKEVRLTPENGLEHVLLRYNPTTRQIEAG